ncbi:MAG: hypothetical protein RR198_03625 [Oscillospiraceae bacterium]
MELKEKYTLPKGNDTCCHICALCKNPCEQRFDCTGACGGCPHPCWADPNVYYVKQDK